MQGETHPQNSLIRFSTSILGSWNSWWFFGLFFLFLFFLFLLVLCFLQNDRLNQQASSEFSLGKYSKDDRLQKSDRCCNGLGKKNACSRAPMVQIAQQERRLEERSFPFWGALLMPIWPWKCQFLTPENQSFTQNTKRVGRSLSKIQQNMVSSWYTLNNHLFW